MTGILTGTAMVGAVYGLLASPRTPPVWLGAALVGCLAMLDADLPMAGRRVS